ncbi:hypothetical protein R3P38DRAFT_2802789 [Favolaschia claudopus]|uniref:PDZ domain-containing protein n=1 Tax=Favolaschia claudopus TaxID=2862362 RepID=A0AAV9ZTV8_9AGAR
MGLAIEKVRTSTKPNGTRLGSSLTGASFIFGDPFATLIRTPTNVSLALARSTEILVDGKRVADVNVSSIQNAKAIINLTGQILLVKAVVPRPDDALNESEEICADSTWSWLWLGSYLMSKSSIRGKSPRTLPILYPPEDILSNLLIPKRLPLTTDFPSMKCGSSTPRARHGQWIMVYWWRSLSSLWKRVEAEQTELREMPNIKDALIGFPYLWATGIPALISAGGTEFLTAKFSDDPCLYCSEVPSNWRGHMGAHILRKLRNAGEIERDKKDKKSGQVKTYPEFPAVPTPQPFDGSSFMYQRRARMASRQGLAPRSGPPRRAASHAQRSGTGVENPSRLGRRPQHNYHMYLAQKIIVPLKTPHNDSKAFELFQVNQQLNCHPRQAAAPRSGAPQILKRMPI